MRAPIAPQVGQLGDLVRLIRYNSTQGLADAKLSIDSDAVDYLGKFFKLPLVPVDFTSDDFASGYQWYEYSLLCAKPEFESSEIIEFGVIDVTCPELESYIHYVSDIKKDNHSRTIRKNVDCSMKPRLIVSSRKRRKA